MGGPFLECCVSSFVISTSSKDTVKCHFNISCYLDFFQNPNVCLRAKKNPRFRLGGLVAKGSCWLRSGLLQIRIGFFSTNTVLGPFLECCVSSFVISTSSKDAVKCHFNSFKRHSKVSF